MCFVDASTGKDPSEEFSVEGSKYDVFVWCKSDTNNPVQVIIDGELGKVRLLEIGYKEVKYDFHPPESTG